MPSVRSRRRESPSAAPPALVHRQPSPAPAASPQPTQTTQATQAIPGAHKEAETRVKALKKDVAHLESQAEQDPDYYEPLLLKAQCDLTAANEALQRAKPVGSQLQSCLSSNGQLDRAVETLGAELAGLEERVLASERSTMPE